MNLLASASHDGRLHEEMGQPIGLVFQIGIRLTLIPLCLLSCVCVLFSCGLQAPVSLHTGDMGHGLGPSVVPYVDKR